jgi:hypothetical protein
MNDQENLQPKLRQEAINILHRLPPAEREALLIKCWMSHDARWFMAVTKEYGMQVTNRLNQIASHELGKVEASRLVRALGLPPVQTLDEYLLAQEIFIGFLGPDLLEYRVRKIGDTEYETHVEHCFAYDNAQRAGVADEYECGIFARVTGWLEALGFEYEMNPCLGKCLKSQGQECVYTVNVRQRTP